MARRILVTHRQKRKRYQCYKHRIRLRFCRYGSLPKLPIMNLVLFTWEALGIIHQGATVKGYSFHVPPEHSEACDDNAMTS